jgi:pimeloyl-ACP methyl ester carboxylesterase
MRSEGDRREKHRNCVTGPRGGPTLRRPSITLKSRTQHRPSMRLIARWFLVDRRRFAAQAANKARRIAAMCRLTRPVAPLMFNSAIVRRLALRSINVARGADRVAAARAVEAVDDTVACTVTLDEVFSADEGQIAPLDPLPCPITLAWSEKDSLLPVATYGEVARERLPHATFQILPDVGHVPMLDDPELVARTILAVTGAGMPQC